MNTDGRTAETEAYPELVLHQLQSMVLQFHEQRPSLVIREVFEAPLQDPASIGMRRQVVDVALERRNKR